MQGIQVGFQNEQIGLFQFCRLAHQNVFQCGTCTYTYIHPKSPYHNNYGSGWEHSSLFEVCAIEQGLFGIHFPLDYSLKAIEIFQRVCHLNFAKCLEEASVSSF